MPISPVWLNFISGVATGLCIYALVSSLIWAIGKLSEPRKKKDEDDEEEYFDFLIDHGLMLAHSKHGWSVVRDAYPHLPFDPSCVDHQNPIQAIQQAIKTQGQK